MFLLKLVLTPVFVGIISLVGRRWGSKIGGILAGLPVTAGPICVFIWLEHGTGVASAEAYSTLMGIVSLIMYCFVYEWCSLRFSLWWCLSAGLVTYFLFTFLLRFLLLPLWLTTSGLACLILLALLLFPRDPYNQVAEVKPPRWEPIARMITATLFVLLLTTAVNLLGPNLSGLLSTFPILATTLGGFAHYYQGAYSARMVLRGMVTGLFSFITFFTVVSGLLPFWGGLATFLCAVVLALFIQSVVFWTLRWKSRRLLSVE